MSEHELEENRGHFEWLVLSREAIHLKPTVQVAVAMLLVENCLHWCWCSQLGCFVLVAFKPSTAPRTISNTRITSSANCTTLCFFFFSLAGFPSFLDNLGRRSLAGSDTMSCIDNRMGLGRCLESSNSSCTGLASTKSLKRQDKVALLAQLSSPPIPQVLAAAVAAKCCCS